MREGVLNNFSVVPPDGRLIGGAAVFHTPAPAAAAVSENKNNFIKIVKIQY
jgi:hypothetical protein